VPCIASAHQCPANADALRNFLWRVADNTPASTPPAAIQLLVHVESAGTSTGGVSADSDVPDTESAEQDLRRLMREIAANLDGVASTLVAVQDRIRYVFRADYLQS